MKIKDLPHEERPRERLIQWGSAALTNQELVALLVDSGHKGASALELAQQVLVQFSGLSGLYQCGLPELMEVPGIGLARACRIKGALEVGKRLQQPEKKAPRISSSRDVVAQCHPWFWRAEREKFLALALDAKQRLIQVLPIATGSLISCPVHPREVFRPLIRAGAISAIVAHNHPSSGDPEPSSQDLEITRRLWETGRILGIPLVDHVIVGRDRYVSLAERGIVSRERFDKG